MFRYKKSVPVSYERQGYIYFSSLLYREMPERAQRKILNLCMECGGGDYYRALFEFVTTDANATYICMKHSLSPVSYTHLAKAPCGAGRVTGCL